VLRKLISALSLFYIRTISDLGLALSKLVFRVMNNDTRVSSENNIRTIKKHELLLLSIEVYVMALWFIDALADEAFKVMSVVSKE
jgi:hypothetical protein